MGEDRKNIIVIKTKYEVPALNSTGLMMLFLDYTQKKFVRISTLTVSGEHLYKIEIKEKVLQLIPKMIHGQDEYTVNRDYDVKIKNGMTTVLDQQNAEKVVSALAAKDVTVLDNFLKGNLKKILSEDMIEVKFAVEQIGPSVFTYLQTTETLEHMTFSQKSEIVRKFNCGRKDLADKILKESINDILLLKVSARDSAKNIFIVIYFSTESKSVAKIDIAAADGETAFNVKSTFVDFISGVHELGPISDAKIDSDIRAVIKSLVPDTIISVSKGGNSEKVTQFFRAALSSVLSSAEIEASVDFINSLFLYGMVDFSDTATAGDNSESGSKMSRKTVDIKLVLSPSKGKNLLKLTPGDKIFVIPDKETLAGRKMIDQLNLDVEGKIKHIVVPIHEIRKDEQNGYEVLVRLGGDLFGKSYEEQDVRVKCVETGEPEKNSKSKMSIVLGLLAGIAVIAVTVVIIFAVL